MKPFDARLAGMGSLGIARIDADHQRVAVVLRGMTASPAMAVVDFTTKPLVNLVWIGALLAVLGTGVAGIRRARERTPLREPKQGAPPRRPISREVHA
jgi:cytochrome c biogenesis factor